MTAIAEVCINVQASRIRKTFSYAVPPEFDFVNKGWRVIVPFGSSCREGFVIEIRDNCEAESYAIKSILDVLDDQPWFDQEMLATAAWLSEYYVCSLADAMRLFIPGKSGIKSQVVYEVNPDASVVPLIQDNDLYEYVLKTGMVSWPQLRSRFGGNCRQKLMQLLQDGLITARMNSRSRSQNKTQKVLCLNVTQCELEQVLLNWQGKPAQKKLLNRFTQQSQLVISKGPEGIAYSSPWKALVEQGYLTESNQVVIRDSYANVCGFSVDHILTPTQHQVLEKINQSILCGEGRTFLLHGATGSGKTEIYMRAAALALSQKKQVLILIPEIAQTDQLLNRFRSRFGGIVAVIHSRLSVAERRDVWDAFRNQDKKIVIGTRSALFVPGGGIGLIIVDEEHEFTYKQEEHPRYHARDSARIRAESLGATLVLGSATPSMETYFSTRQGVTELLLMPDRIDCAKLPEVEVVDMREQLKQGRKGMISASLEELLHNTFASGNQAILLLNRRGYSTFVMCRECGYVLKCSRCSVPLVYHLQGSVLRCHYCDIRRTSPTECPSCGSHYIRFFGAGTQKLEEELNALFPEVRILRMDHDTTGGKMGHGEVLDKFRQGHADVLVGTQMVAKGHDFSNVTAVGILAADSALNLPDFRSAEKTFSLIVQAAGRAGRGLLPGKVIVQTYHPDHYAVVAGAEQDFESFYRQEIIYRHDLNYPPCSKFIKLTFLGTDERKVRTLAEKSTHLIQSDLAERNIGCKLLGPYLAPISRIEDVFRFHLLIQGNQLVDAKQILIERGLAGDPLVSIDVDPIEMM